MIPTGYMIEHVMHSSIFAHGPKRYWDIVNECDCFISIVNSTFVLRFSTENEVKYKVLFLVSHSSLWNGNITNFTWRYKMPFTRSINTLRPRQNGHDFADDIFKCVFLNENVSISVTISLKYVLKGSIDKIPAWVQIMVCADQATSHYLNQWWLAYRRIYASLSLNELSYQFWAFLWLNISTYWYIQACNLYSAIPSTGIPMHMMYRGFTLGETRNNVFWHIPMASLFLCE